jgi:hypothetical protein
MSLLADMDQYFQQSKINMLSMIRIRERYISPGSDPSVVGLDFSDEVDNNTSK